MQKILSLVMLAVVLTGCSSAPPPKQPDESNRQPVNKTLPPALKGIVK